MKNSYPLFIVSNLDASSEYLQDKFGYEKVFDSDWYIQLAHKDQQIALMIENSKNQPEFLHTKYRGEGVVLTIEIEDVDKIYKKFEKQDILHDLVTEEWGQRHFIVKSPGNLIIDVVNYTEPEDYK